MITKGTPWHTIRGRGDTTRLEEHTTTTRTSDMDVETTQNVEWTPLQWRSWWQGEWDSYGSSSGSGDAGWQSGRWSCVSQTVGGVA